MKFWIEVTYLLEIEAGSVEEAENWGYDLTIDHPQTGERVQPDSSDVSK